MALGSVSETMARCSNTLQPIVGQGNSMAISTLTNPDKVRQSWSGVTDRLLVPRFNDRSCAFWWRIDIRHGDGKKTGIALLSPDPRLCGAIRVLREAGIDAPSSWEGRKNPACQSERHAADH